MFPRLSHVLLIGFDTSYLLPAAGSASMRKLLWLINPANSNYDCSIRVNVQLLEEALHLDTGHIWKRAYLKFMSCMCSHAAQLESWRQWCMRYCTDMHAFTLSTWRIRWMMAYHGFACSSRDLSATSSHELTFISPGPSRHRSCRRCRRPLSRS